VNPGIDRNNLKLQARRDSKKQRTMILPVYFRSEIDQAGLRYTRKIKQSQHKEEFNLFTLLILAVFVKSGKLNLLPKLKHLLYG